jgi:hypothetical protein
VRQYLYPTGSVYVLVNVTAARTKVGMTGIGVNDVADRLRDINDIWTERKISCQICGGRLVNVGRLVPPHVKSGMACLGGSAPPLERSIALAERHLMEVQSRINSLAGAEKGSAVRVARTLKQRVEKYTHHVKPVGEWVFDVAYFTEGVAEVEALTHQKLAVHADRQAPFGEVFCCTATEAATAVEAALDDLGLLHSAIKRTRLPEDPRRVVQRRLWSDA